jgi:phage terminase large subunit-like protein
VVRSAVTKRRTSDAGQRAVRFINNLTHTKGEWAEQPFALRPWQEAILQPLFGTLRSDGRRRYRTCYVEIPRKNGKTELAAAVALYMLLGDGEQGAEVYSAAVDREQASLVFNVAAQMVRNDAELSAQCEVIDSRRRIYHPRTNSFYCAIPAEAPGRHGYNASAVIYDELHAAPNRDLYDVLATSTGARRQPLTFVITTAGWDRNSICYELHDYAVKVRDGIIEDETFMSVLYGAADDADWLDEAVWRACNPALDDFRSLEEMQVAGLRAREVPGQQNVFRRLYLCQWTEQANRWLDMSVWDQNGGASPELGGRPCYAGLDLSTTQDITALELYFPDEDGGGDVLSYFWIPEETVHLRARRDRVPYDVWSRGGLITPTEGNVVDYDVMRADINALGERYEIREIAIDRWNSTQLQTQLMADGFTVVPFGQGFASMTAPTKELERLVLERKLRHGGHPVLRWMASNVAVRQDPAGNVKIDKAKSTERVDGMVALAMAVGRAMVRQEVRSVYEDRGLLAI